MIHRPASPSLLLEFFPRVPTPPSPEYGADHMPCFTVCGQLFTTPDACKSSKEAQNTAAGAGIATAHPSIGAHTIGQARCTNFRARIYNESNLDALFARTRQSNCPRASGNGDNNLAPLDVQTSTNFDNHYFINLLNKRGLLHSDQLLFNGGSTDSIVRGYSSNPASFSSDFTAAMIRMGDISPLTGSNGEIRKNCRRAN